MGSPDSTEILTQMKSLIETQIPEQSKSLSDNVENLEKVAQYCEDIYVNSKDADKQHLLNETKSYTTQALASVAYQIHVLANSFLMLLDNQSMILDDMNVSMTHFNHEVNIHKEKVARREIGILTTNKCVMRTVKVKKPEMDEKPVKYVRKPIDYSLLDDVGHGVKLPRQSANLDPLSKIGVGRQNSYSSTHSSSGMNAMNTSQSTIVDPNTPPLMFKANTIMNVNAGNGLNTVRSIASTASSYHYRAPVAPPSVPSEYLSRQELGIYSSKKELNQSAGAESLSGAYGATLSYRRSSNTNNNNNNNASLNTTNPNFNPNNSEYSDTIDRRMANNYIQQFGVYASNQGPMMNPNNNTNSSVGYASGKDIGLIRTNLNNIDYATNGTIYRRPQLHPSIYERSMNNVVQVNNPTIHQQLQQQAKQQQQQQYMRTASQFSNGSRGNASSLSVLPPPPPPSAMLYAATNNVDPTRAVQYQSANNGNIAVPENIENEVFGGDYIPGNDFDDEDDDDLIPNWVPIDRCLEKVITTFDYEGTREDELSFKENMFIYVIKKNDDHWYEGIMKNENGDIVQGLYPYNYARCVKRYVHDARVTQC